MPVFFTFEAGIIFKSVVEEFFTQLMVIFRNEIEFFTLICGWFFQNKNFYAFVVVTDAKTRVSFRYHGQKPMT